MKLKYYEDQVHHHSNGKKKKIEVITDKNSGTHDRDQLTSFEICAKMDEKEKTLKWIDNSLVRIRAKKWFPQLNFLNFKTFVMKCFDVFFLSSPNA